SGTNLAGLGFAEETLDASEIPAEIIMDAALSPSLGGGTRLIIIKDAHALRNPDVLAELCTVRTTLDQLAYVCVFLSKDLDGRKKFSKILLDKAAVVPCEEILEADREPWIAYLAKSRNVSIDPATSIRLAALDPWSLDIVDLELEKQFLAGASTENLIQPGRVGGGAEEFVDALFSRELKIALACIENFADQQDESLPLVGLLAWNVRHLLLLLTENELGGRGALRLNPHAAEKLKRWCRKWTLPEALELQEALTTLDYELKQTPLMPLGSWDSLVMRFCR
ncbi:MAG: hypothetical protein A2Z97_10465, partial [Bdellovibrionales bacterium GWB1_52_6]